NSSAYRQRRASEDCSPARTSSRLASLMAPLEFAEAALLEHDRRRREERNQQIFISRSPATNNGWVNKWSAQCVSSAPIRSKERSNARFSSRRLARALELSFDAPLWIRDHSSGACLARLRGWRGVRLEGVAEEAAQLLVPARFGSDSGAGGGARKMNRADSRPARLEWFGTPSIVSVS